MDSAGDVQEDAFPGQCCPVESCGSHLPRAALQRQTQDDAGGCGMDQSKAGAAKGALAGCTPQIPGGLV